MKKAVDELYAAWPSGWHTPLAIGQTIFIRWPPLCRQAISMTLRPNFCSSCFHRPGRGFLFHHGWGREWRLSLSPASFFRRRKSSRFRRDHLAGVIYVRLELTSWMSPLHADVDTSHRWRR
ncbi:hypothetical protein CEXT_513471 [Caerostris extrusa]|uniref:Uncharacterized protein n=1 Tax=Caerostris extrusa TaxID=172846 RepID=A0AAV4U6K3_CAEEX|nr:hypothetical protein CEXT_513471 [Caerostris extrusa]